MQFLAIKTSPAPVFPVHLSIDGIKQFLRHYHSGNSSGLGCSAPRQTWKPFTYIKTFSEGLFLQGRTLFLLHTQLVGHFTDDLRGCIMWLPPSHFSASRKDFTAPWVLWSPQIFSAATLRLMKITRTARMPLFPRTPVITFTTLRLTTAFTGLFFLTFDDNRAETWAYAVFRTALTLLTQNWICSEQRLTVSSQRPQLLPVSTSCYPQSLLIIVKRKLI